MGFTGQKYGVFESKVWHFWVVTHGVLATPDYKTFATRDNGQQTTSLLLLKTTSLQDYETTSGAVAGGTSQELRNYGTTDRASRLKAQSLSILSIPFYTHSSLLTVVMR